MNSFQLDSVFSDNMVLQREKPVKIWGTSSISSTITVKIGEHSTTLRNVEGNWTAVLPAMEAAAGCELTVSSDQPGDQAVVIKNVAIGEVWIAGGQSNMEFPLKFDAEAEASISGADNPAIRFFDYPEISYQGQEEVADFSEYGFWRPCDPDNAPYFSAVGFYFANEIFKSQQVPVGIIGCNWGGTTASTWLEESYLESDKDLHVYLEEYRRAVETIDLDEYERKVEQQRLFMNSPEMREVSDNLSRGVYTREELVDVQAVMEPVALHPLPGPKDKNRPGGLYHTMVEKIAGYTVRGVIWYQGESDADRADIYDKLFAALIRCWRDTWEEELPFLFVQLASFESWMHTSGEHYPILREKQEYVSKTVPAAYMASIMDAGMRYDIHPKDKRTVGERLALLARGKVYGEDILSEAPEVSGVQREKDRLELEFNHAGDGLVIEGDSIAGLQLFTGEKELPVSEVVVDKNKLSFRCQGLDDRERVEIRYAWTDYVKVNLYNSAGIAAKPFKREVD